MAKEKEYRIAVELPREDIGRSSTSETHEAHAIDISIWPILKSRKVTEGERHGQIRTFRFSVFKVYNDKRASADFNIEGFCIGNNKPFRAIVTPYTNSGYGLLIM